jgi:hypothetical protein
VHGDRHLSEFWKAPVFYNAAACVNAPTIYIAMTMETTYLWGSFTSVFFVLCHTTYSEFVAFHFIAFSPRRHVADLVPASGDNLPEKRCRIRETWA